MRSLPEGAKNQYAMVGFRVCNTLSENGSVTRGVCATICCFSYITAIVAIIAASGARC